jgi:hypothetical protein
VTIALETLAGTPQPPIDRWGRYLLPGPDGKTKPHTRATTIAKTPADTTALEKWKMRMVAAGIGIRPELYALASSHDPETDRKTFEEITSKAMEAAGSSTKASLGTALHRMTERLDRGEITLADVPEEWRDRCAKYVETMAANGIVSHPAHLEQRLIDDRYTVAGTTDQICTLPNRELPVIADKKTGANLDFSWLEISIQLACYANHTARADWDPRRGEWRRGDRIDVDRRQGLIIHLPATGDVRCELYLIDLDAGYGGYLLAHEIREFRKTKQLAQVYRPTAPTVTLEQWVTDRLNALTPAAKAALKLRWPLRDAAGKPVRYANPTPEQTEALIAALDTVEAEHQIPFGPSRPEGETTTKTQRKNRK